MAYTKLSFYLARIDICNLKMWFNKKEKTLFSYKRIETFFYWEPCHQYLMEHLLIKSL